MNIKTYSFLILILLLVWGQSISGQVVPAPPTITSVTIDPQPDAPGAVRIYWLPSISPSVTGYILFKYVYNEQFRGYQPINLYIPATDFTYLDNTAEANIKSESYYMVAYNGDVTNIGENCQPHSTINLNTIVNDSCQRTNTLTWNQYVGWEGGAYYNIINGNGEILTDGYTDTVLIIPNIQSDAYYTYYVRAIRNSNPTFKSISNTDSVYASAIKQPDPTNFYIKNITYDGSTANFTAVIDTAADLIGHTLMVSADGSNFTDVAFDSINKNAPIIEFSHDTTNQPLFYKINAIGVCNDVVLSTKEVKPIVLKIEDSNETEVTLDWNKSYIESVEEYAVSLTIDDGNPVVIPPQNSTTYYYEELDTEDKGELFCFTITATETLGNTSLSNTVCTSRMPKLNFPNAFTPNGDGTNDLFGPFENYIKNVDLAEFKLIIYDKFGGAIFSTDNPKDKWTGLSSRTSLKYVPEGGYIYYLWFKTAQQKTYEKSGTINVVYP